MAGADFQIQLQKMNIKGEYLRRNTSLPDPAIANPKYGLIDPFFVKEGGYLNLEYPLNKNQELLYSIDFLHRTGNLSSGSALTDNSWVLRNRFGYNRYFGSGLIIKINIEYWNFTDFIHEVAVRTGAVFSF
jgi:hypothetical protein